jgi:Domain of unknown function (DUF4837)
MKYFLGIFLFLLLWACENKQVAILYHKPEPRGKILEIAVVIEKSLWTGEIGQSIRTILDTPLAGIVPTESRFTYWQIEPKDFNGFLKCHRNLLIVALTDTAKTKIYTQKEPYAFRQRAFYLNDSDIASLQKNIQKNQSQITNYFWDSERERASYQLFGSDFSAEQHYLSQWVKKQYQVAFPIQVGYEVAKYNDSFVWLRIFPEPDKNIWFIKIPAKKAPQIADFPHWRNQYAQKYLHDTLSKHIWVEVQKSSFLQENQTFRGNFRLSDKRKGGYFVGQCFWDKKKNYFYYLECFGFAPNQPKRQEVLEAEAVLKIDDR